MNPYTQSRIGNILLWVFLASVLFNLISPLPGFSGTLPDHGLGILGAILMLLTLEYPFRKRLLKKRGRDNPLFFHVFFGLSGATLAMVHGSARFTGPASELLFVVLLFLVSTGLVGKFLFRRVSVTLRDQKKNMELLRREFFRVRQDPVMQQACDFMGERAIFPDLPEAPEDAGMEDPLFISNCDKLLKIARGIAETETAIKTFSATKKIFSRWAILHMILAVFFWGILATHVANTLYYGLRWLR
ncbi:MAG: hypothetical protein JRI97_12990 [Deltaproteobacteria bacterium]|nr:hypothetical protein [Deltaproteobacteria bacterium]